MFLSFLSGDYEINKSKTKLNLKSIEIREIRAAVAKIKTLKNSGVDNISSHFLKLALPKSCQYFLVNNILPFPSVYYQIRAFSDLQLRLCLY